MGKKRRKIHILSTYTWHGPLSRFTCVFLSLYLIGCLPFVSLRLPLWRCCNVCAREAAYVVLCCVVWLCFFPYHDATRSIHNHFLMLHHQRASVLFVHSEERRMNVAKLSWELRGWLDGGKRKFKNDSFWQTSSEKSPWEGVCVFVWGETSRLPRRKNGICIRYDYLKHCLLPPRAQPAKQKMLTKYFEIFTPKVYLHLT